MPACAPPEDEPLEQAAHAVESPLFRPYVTHRLGNPAYGAWAAGIAIGDLDGDGRKDLVVTTDGPHDSPNAERAHIFRQSSSGSLEQIAQPWVGTRPLTAAIGDVTGDGRPDIVVSDFGYNGTKIVVLPQDASGGFGPLITYPTPNAYALRLGDLNDDGKLDVVSVAFGGYSQNVSVFLQREAGGLAPPVLYSAYTGGRNTLEIADMNNDGRTDVIVMSGQGYAEPNFNILHRNADGTLAPAVSYDLPINENAQGIGIGDLNGDGLNDLAMAYGGNRPYSHIARFLQNGAGTLGAAISQTSYDIPTSLVVADVTSDGRADVIVGHRGWGRAGVYRQTATGTLAAEELYPVGYSEIDSMGQAVGDLNGDGLPDVAFADSSAHAAVVLYRTNAPPSLSIDAPTGASHFAGMPLEVRWTASDDTGLTGFDVMASSNGGASFAAVQGCQALSAAARSCTWSVPGPASPSFVIRVTARDNGGNSANADVAFALVTPTLNVLAPNGGESWFLGTAQAITWSSNLPAGDTVSIDISRDGGASWASLAQVPNTGSFAWTVAGAASSAARFRLSWNMNPGFNDSSDGNISLIAPSIEVAPGGAGWPIGAARTINWSSNLPASEAVAIELSRDGGASWTPLAGAAPNTGSFAWTVTGPASAATQVRVSSNSHPTAIDTGEAFAIFTPALSVTSPNTAVTWSLGSVRTITWSHNVGAGEPFALEITRDGGATWSQLASGVLSSGANSGAFTWTVSGAKTRNARVRVTWLGAPPVSDESNVAFIIK